MIAKQFDNLAAAVIRDDFTITIVSPFGVVLLSVARNACLSHLTLTLIKFYIHLKKDFYLHFN